MLKEQKIARSGGVYKSVFRIRLTNTRL